MDLLGDAELFGNQNNLCINRSLIDPNEKWLPYIKIDGQLFEVFDGDWYQQYAKKMVVDVDNEFLLSHWVVY